MNTSERLSLFNNQLDNIRDLKTNQWRFSYLGLVAQAALVVAQTHLEAVGFDLLLVIISSLVLVASFLLIDEAQKKIALRRWALNFLSEDMKKSMLDARKEIISRKYQSWPERWRAESHFATLFFCAQFGGFLVALCIIAFDGSSPVQVCLQKGI